ncbi:phenylalanine hydroxylase gene cluster transcription activator [Pseudomonas aeruginosa VRFPA02]|nr:phenylalanine hydroxylase gene cluster transcription activator [Pseudomonas aeruginosa VRFPA02]
MALNCAGLPESMAETELFGYGPGAPARSCWRAPATWPARAGSRRSWR